MLFRALLNRAPTPPVAEYFVLGEDPVVGRRTIPAYSVSGNRVEIRGIFRRYYGDLTDNIHSLDYEVTRRQGNALIRAFFRADLRGNVEVQNVARTDADDADSTDFDFLLTIPYRSLVNVRLDEVRSVAPLVNQRFGDPIFNYFNPSRYETGITDEANAKATTLLRGMLTETEIELLDHARGVVVVGSEGGTYWLDATGRTVPARIRLCLTPAGPRVETVHSLCIYIHGMTPWLSYLYPTKIPTADVVVGHKISIESGEIDWLAIANDFEFSFVNAGPYASPMIDRKSEQLISAIVFEKWQARGWDASEMYQRNSDRYIVDNVIPKLGKHNPVRATLLRYAAAGGYPVREYTYDRLDEVDGADTHVYLADGTETQDVRNVEVTTTHNIRIGPVTEFRLDGGQWTTVQFRLQFQTDILPTFPNLRVSIDT
jgi:hypothetical protein